MNRILSGVLTFGVAALTIGAALPACAKNDKSIFIQAVLAPPQNRSNGACLYTPDSNAPGLFSGRLDIAISKTYSPVMQIANQLITRADPLDPRAESNRVHLKGLVSRVTDPNGNQINELTGNGSGYTDASSNNAPGLGLISAPIIDANTIAALEAQEHFALFGPSRTVLTQVRVFGTTLGGEDVESGEFQFVVEICRGCLLNYNSDPPVVDPKNIAQYNCNGTVAAGTTVTPPCQLGQDEGASCQFCSTDSTTECAAPKLPY